MGSDESKERRRSLRFPVALPVHVKGWLNDGTAWEEDTSTDDVSEGGLSIPLGCEVRLGQALQVRLPLPKRLRSYDRELPEFETFTLVRRINRGGETSRVGVMFFGKQPPRGFIDRPWARYLLPSDPPDSMDDAPEGPATQPFVAAFGAAAGGWEPLSPGPSGEHPAPERDRRRWPRLPSLQSFTLELQDEWGVVLKEELTVAVDISKGGACLRSAMDFRAGEVLLVQEAGGDFGTRATVHAVTGTPKDATLLHVEFLDRQAPGRLLTEG